MPTPQILLFNLDTPKGAKIRRMCLPLKIRTRLVPQEAYGLPLSALVAGNLEAPAPTEEQTFTDEQSHPSCSPQGRPDPNQSGLAPHRPAGGAAP